MRALGDVARYLVEMLLHGSGVDKRQGEHRALPTRRADRAELIGVLVALIGRLARPRPRLAHRRTRALFWPIRASSWNHISIGVPAGSSYRWALSVREKFLVSRDDLGVLTWMLWVCAHVREAELLQQRSDIAFAIVDAQALGDDVLQTDAVPAQALNEWNFQPGLSSMRMSD